MRDAMARLHLMGGRSKHLFVRGQGSWLWDAEGRAYLDFNQGQASNSLGHSPTVLVDTLRRQSEQLINLDGEHCSRGQLKLAARLCQATGSEQVAFCDSAEQANALAVQLALRWARTRRAAADTLVLAGGGTHGLSAEACGIRQVRVSYNDLDALSTALDARVAALLLAPVQIDDGLVPATLEYLQGAQRLCQERDVLLLLDEGHSAIGRCGALLAEELYGVRADLLSLGTGLAGGLPLAAVLVRGGVAFDELPEHCPASALFSAAGVAVLGTVLESGFLAQVCDVAEHLREGLARIARRHGHGPLRGHGLLLGLPLIGQSACVVAQAAFEQGLLIGVSREDCLRLSPALTVSHGNVEEMLRRLSRAMDRVARGAMEVA